MSADEEFGRLVGDRLRDEVADIHVEHDLAGAVRRRQVRRTWTIRTSIAAPLVAAAAVVVATAGSGATSDQPGREQAAPPVTTTTQARVENLAHVQSMTIQALRTVEEYVIYEKENLSSGWYESWTDRATVRYRSDSYTTIPAASTDRNLPQSEIRAPGPPDEAQTGPPRLNGSIAGDGPLGDRYYTSIDYDRKTWTTFHDTEPPGVLEVPDVLDADALKKAIDEGRMELIGQEKVGDKDTHHLRLFATVRGYQIDLWVDATSYLPVKETTTVIGGDPEPVMTSEYKWLPRNDENLAKLVLTPPPGFTKE